MVRSEAWESRKINCSRFYKKIFRQKPASLIEALRDSLKISSNKSDPLLNMTRSRKGQDPANKVNSQKISSMLHHLNSKPHLLNPWHLIASNTKPTYLFRQSNSKSPRTLFPVLHTNNIPTTTMSQKRSTTNSTRWKIASCKIK